MINNNNFIIWEIILNKRLLSKIYFFKKAVRSCYFFVYILLVIICPSMASNVLIPFFMSSYATFVSYYFGL